MDARTFPAPRSWRRFAVPVGLGTLGLLMSAALARLLKPVRQPTVSSMSDEWLRQLDAQSHADDYSSRAHNRW